MNIVFILMVLFILIGLSGFFSSSETAFSSLNIIRIKQYSRSSKRKKAKSAKRILYINNNFSTFLATILVSNNIVNIAAASLATFLFTDLLFYGERGILYATIVISLLVIIFSEIIPKTFARIIPEKIALQYSFIIYFLMKILKPFTTWSSKLDNKISNKYEDEKITATESELMEIVETIEKEGVLEHSESKLIQSAIVFDDVSVKKIMTPKQEVILASKESSIDEIAKIFAKNNFSRLPIFDKHKQKVIGIIHQRDIFNCLYFNKKKRITQIMNTPVYISHRRLLPFALEHLQKNTSHLGVIVNNLKEKKFLGIVSLEDLIEELVGEIYDEHDDAPKSVFEVGNHIFHVKGSTLLSYLFGQYLEEVRFPKTNAISVKGWIREMAGKIEVNSIIYYENLKIKVLKVVNSNAQFLEIERLTNKKEED